MAALGDRLADQAPAVPQVLTKHRNLLRRREPRHLFPTCDPPAPLEAAVAFHAREIGRGANSGA